MSGTFVGVTTAYGENIGSLAINKPAGTIAGDRMFLYHGYEDGNKTFNPTGGATWNFAYPTRDNTNTTFATLSLAYSNCYLMAHHKTAGASEPSSYTLNINQGGTVVSLVAMLFVYRGFTTQQALYYIDGFYGAYVGAGSTVLNMYLAKEFPVIKSFMPQLRYQKLVVPVWRVEDCDIQVGPEFTVRTLVRYAKSSVLLADMDYDMLTTGGWPDTAPKQITFGASTKPGDAAQIWLADSDTIEERTQDLPDRQTPTADHPILGLTRGSRRSEVELFNHLSSGPLNPDQVAGSTEVGTFDSVTPLSPKSRDVVVPLISE